MKFKTWISLLTLLFCKMYWVSAQTEPSGPVRFSTLSVSGDIKEIYFDEAPGSPVELRAVDYVRSPYYRVRSELPLRLYRLLPPKAGETEPQKENVGVINWPASPGPFLLLIGKRGNHYRFSVVSDDTQSFPLGSFRVFNASELSVVIQVGDVHAVIKPGGGEVLRPDLDKEKRGALFQVAAKVGEEPKLVYSNLWNGSKTQRTLVFILDRDNPRAPIGLKRLHESDLVLRRKRGERE